MPPTQEIRLTLLQMSWKVLPDTPATNMEAHPKLRITPLVHARVISDKPRIKDVIQRIKVSQDRVSRIQFLVLMKMLNHLHGNGVFLQGEEGQELAIVREVQLIQMTRCLLGMNDARIPSIKKDCSRRVNIPPTVPRKDPFSLSSKSASIPHSWGRIAGTIWASVTSTSRPRVTSRLNFRTFNRPTRARQTGPAP